MFRRERDSRGMGSLTLDLPLDRLAVRSTESLCLMGVARDLVGLCRYSEVIPQRSLATKAPAFVQILIGHD